MGWGQQPRSKPDDVRSYDGAESRPFDHQSPVCPLAHFCDFRADMLSFSIAIRPYHEQVCVPRFGLQVTLDVAEVLSVILVDR